MTVRPDRPDECELAAIDVPMHPVIDLTDRMPLDPDDDPTSYPGAQPNRALGTKPEDFPSFYVRHRTTMTHVAGRYLSDRRDADEVVQEAFLKMFLALPELPTELAALAYARRTVVNLCIDRLRAAGRRPRLVDLEGVPEATLGLVESDDPVIAAEDAVIVREALARLTPLHRQALVMREVEELPLPQIAAKLDIPEESVKHVLHRARRALRRILAGSAVDPSVDVESLSLAQLVSAKPVRVAVLLLMVVAGVLTGRPIMGLGHSHPRMSALKDAAPLAQTPLVVPSNPAPAIGLLPPRPVTGGAKPARPSTTAAAPHPAGVPVAPFQQALSGAPQASAPLPNAPTVLKTQTPPVRPVPVVVPPTHAAAPAVVVVTGLSGVTSARVANETRALSVGGYRSSSTLTAATPTGEFALNQALSIVPTATGLTVDSAQVNPVLPTPDGGTGYLLDTDNVITTPVASGIEVTYSGVATPLVGDPNTPGAAVVVIVTAVYDHSLTQVLKETVNLALPAVAASTTGLSAPPVGPTPDPSALAVTPSIVDLRHAGTRP